MKKFTSVNLGSRFYHRKTTFTSLLATVSSLSAVAIILTLSPVSADTVDSSSPITSDGGVLPPSQPYASLTTTSAANSFAPTVIPNDSPFWQGGHLPVLLTATVAEVWDDNIFLSPDKTSDFITKIDLMGEYKIGDRTIVDGNYFDIYYAPSFDIYADHPSQDAFNQNVGALFEHRFSKLDVSIEQTYQKENATSAAIGDLVTSNIYVTHATANYEYSDKLGIYSSFTQTVTDYDSAGLTSSNEWSGDTYFLYKYDSKLSIGFGPKFGWLDVESAPNQTYQQLLVRADYLYSSKLSFASSGGAEVREYQNGGTIVSPVFSLSGTYHPFESTNITLRGGRQYLPSYNFIGQNYIATSVSLTLRQRFLRNFYYNLGLGFENDEYQGAGTAIVGPTRNDNYYFVTTGVDWNPNSWFMASVYYKYQTDDSTFSAYTFNDNQIGISASVSY